MPDDKQAPDAEGGRTRPGGAPDETRPLRPIGPDETEAFERGRLDDTRTFPVGEPAGQPTGAPPATVWAGRAEVPPAGTRRAGTPPSPWEQPIPEDTGRWWMPIVLGLIGLLLLGVLGYGLWLIAAAEDEAAPGGVPTPAAPTAPRTAAPATTRAPEPTEPRDVEVPRLAGEPLADAQDRLDELGLRYRVEFEVTDEQEPGTVLRTEPDDGERVEAGSRVTLIVATAPEQTDPAEPTPTGSPT